MEKKTKNKKKSTSVNKVDKKIKQEVKEEKDNKKIIIVALLLALLIGIFTYWQVSKNNEGKSNKLNESNDKVIEEIVDEEEKESEELSESETEFLGYISTVMKPIKFDNEEKDEAKEIYYSIKFETNGGKEIEEQILTQDEVTTLVLPIKEGWVFQGWYKDIELTEEFVFGDVLTEDITVYAKWGKYISYMYEQTLYERENIVSESDVIPFLSEDKIMETPDGLVLGWFIEELDESGEVITSLEVLENTLLTEEIYKYFESEDIILKAKYLEKFNIEFYEDELSLEPLHIQEVVEGRTISFTEVDTVVKETFPDIEKYGWYYLDSELTKWNVSLEEKADPSITKFYLDETYTLIYTEEKDEDTIITEDDKLTDSGNIIVKEEEVAQNSQIKNENIFMPLEKEGYEFIGWFLVDPETGEDGAMLTEETIIDGDKVYVARWKKIVEEEKDEVIEEITEEEIPVEEEVEPVLEEEVVEEEQLLEEAELVIE